MPRNGAGVYSLPAGNPVVTLTTITSTWANSTMTDIATALTGSVAANGVTPMTGQLRLSDGSVGAPGLSFSTETTSGLYRIGAGDFGFSVAANKRLEILGAGTTLTITPAINQIGLEIDCSGTTTACLVLSSASGATMQMKNAGTLVGALGGSASVLGFGTNNDTVLAAYNTTSLILSTALAIRMSIAVNGTVAINAPTSGTALTITALAGARAVTVSAGPIFVSNPGLPLVVLNSSGSNFGLISNNGANSWSLGTGTSDVTAGTAVLSWNATGNVTVAAPTSGVALTLPSASGAQSFFGSGVNIGLATAFAAGQAELYTTSTTPLGIGTTGAAVLNLYTGSTARLTIDATGIVSLPTGNGTTLGPAWSGIPQIAISSNYNLAGTESGKHIYFTGIAGQAVGIPANASVPFPIGASISIFNDSSNSLALNITTDTLSWMKGGSTAGGNRTIAVGSVVTIVKVTATRWDLSGNGIS